MTNDFRHSESGTELLVRLEGRSSLKNLAPLLFAEEGFPIHGDVVEFHGPEGTGKTEMLYELVARCILPLSVGGLEVEVIFIDTDYHFDMLRLVAILEHRLSQNTEDMMKTCLTRLFVVYCNSSIQLFLTLHSLENLFCCHPALCLVIIDSISAFYWIDRGNGGDSFNKQEANLRKCVEFIEKLVKEYQLVLFSTTQDIMSSNTSSVEHLSFSSRHHPFDINYKPYLCKTWQKSVTHRIFFSKQDICKSNGQTYCFVSFHLSNNTATRRSFSIRDGGIHFL
ncbi:DNA repair protein XRCC2 [Protopterus annectens]|uniref:DNA repair protein XRCC2 n=1 Tax=Protopterus annectens TaxID=7888 RepID=UPI001CFC3FF3|nr:DNA repair protein XRCC2 [Protopterus annectens]